MKNFTWSWDEPDEDIKDSEPDYPERIEDIYRQVELEMQALNSGVDPDGLDKEGQQAWNAFQREQAIEPTWEERERINDLERLAYCGWED